MHASHNLISDAGAKAMLTSVVGPSTLHGVNYVPLWLRLELNHIREPETLLREAEAALREARSSFHNPDVAEDNLICHVKKVSLWSLHTRHVCNATENKEMSTDSRHVSHEAESL